MTALWRYRETESVVKAMDGYTPGEGWVLYAPAQPDINTVLQRAVWDSAEIVHCPTQPAHTEQDVREILQTVQYKLGADRLEIVVRRILGVPK